MGFIKNLWAKFVERSKKARERNREIKKATSAIQTGFTCPKCGNHLNQIVTPKHFDSRYFCEKCGYDGMAKNHDPSKILKMPFPNKFHDNHQKRAYKKVY